MKKWIIVLAICYACPAWGLEISPEGKQEAALFNSFLEAVYVHRNNPQAYFEALKKTLALDPDSKYLRQLLVAAAPTPEQAEPYIDYITMGENTVEDYLAYASYNLKKQNSVQALDAYEKALALRPDDSILLQQYLLLLSTVDLDKTIAVLEKTANEQPAWTSLAYHQIGLLYLRRNQIEQALLYFDKSIQADPYNPQPHLIKAEVYEKTSQFFLMLHELEEVEKMGYADAEVYVRMAAIFTAVRDFPKAEAYFLKAVGQDPHHTAANYFLSLFAEQRGDFQGAINYLQAANDYSTNATRPLQVSFLQQKAGQNEQSLQTLEKAYKQFGDNVEIAFFYGLMLNDRRNYKQAARVFEKLLKSRPEYMEARLHYAYSLESLKKYKHMEEQLQILLEKQPNNASALNLLAYSLAERGERLDEAKELIVRAVAISPKEVAFIDTLGWVYIKQGELEKADAVFSSLPEDAVNANPEIAYHIGVLREKQGRQEESLRYLEKATPKWPAAQKIYQKIFRQK